MIGPNGAGKSTLLKIGRRPAAAARRARSLFKAATSPVCAPREITRLGLAFVPQERNVFATMTVRENLEMGGYLDRRATQAAHRRALRALSHAGRASAGRGAHAERRPAPDPGHGDGADGRAGRAAARRADGGPSPVAAESCSNASRHQRDGVAILMVEQNARGAGDLGARLRAGPGPRQRDRAGARTRGRPDGRASLSRRRAPPMIVSETEVKTCHANTMFTTPHAAACGGRGVAVAAPARAARSGDPIKLGILTPLTGAGGSYGPLMAKAAGGRRGGQRGGRRARPQDRAGERGRPDQPRGRACAPRAS